MRAKVYELVDENMRSITEVYIPEKELAINYYDGHTHVLLEGEHIVAEKRYGNVDEHIHSNLLSEVDIDDEDFRSIENFTDSSEKVKCIFNRLTSSKGELNESKTV
jgi:hypothetical protein